MPFRVARESFPILGVLAALALLALWLLPWTAAVPLALLAFTAWFFRDPERHTPDDPHAVISPADGRVVRSEPQRLSVFMNVFDVHVCRSPMSGTVSSVEHSPGRFLAAFTNRASENNERTEIRLQGREAGLRLVLVAGLIARRIVCKVSEGQRLRAGQRVGLIQFGSRVDVDLPPGSRVSVRVGDRVFAGESVVARLPHAPAAPGRGPDPG